MLYSPLDTVRRSHIKSRSLFPTDLSALLIQRMQPVQFRSIPSAAPLALTSVSITTILYMRSLYAIRLVSTFSLICWDLSRRLRVTTKLFLSQTPTHVRTEVPFPKTEITRVRMTSSLIKPVRSQARECSLTVPVTIWWYIRNSWLPRFRYCCR